jgi:hypothetical protein
MQQTHFVVKKLKFDLTLESSKLSFSYFHFAIIKETQQIHLPLDKLYFTGK